jgi:exosortase B
MLLVVSSRMSRSVGVFSNTQNEQLSLNNIAIWPLVLGFLALYIPTYFSLANGLWTLDDQGHGPLIVMVVIYLFWQNRDHFKQSQTSLTSVVVGWLAFIFGLLCYILGRSQDIYIVDILSQVFVLAGLILIIYGYPALKASWFPLFFLVFMVPLPSVIVDAITLPMKVAVSIVTENVLYYFNYPIAREGVILHIGQYQLLVADACAGMHTLISLEALGLLYLNLVKHDSAIRNISLALLIIPISFTANVIRVISLTLITYYFGDEVGQGFVHGFAGMLLFIVALVLIMSVDSMIQWFVNRRENALKSIKVAN